MNWKMIAMVLAVVLSLGGLVWVYGEKRHQEGVSETELKIANGTYDRTFIYYVDVPAPKPVNRTPITKPTQVDSSALDSLQQALKDSSHVIQYLAKGFSASLEDSVVYPIDDSIAVTFRARHTITINPVKKTLQDFFAPLSATIPVKEIERVVLRDPTFWERVKWFLEGMGLGAGVILLVWVLSG